MVLCKFWLHISKEEQMDRFERREGIAFKRHKMTDEDWRNREKWDAYESAIDEMITKTSTVEAPWTIIPANSKKFARIEVLKTVCEALEKRLKKRK